MRIQSNYDRDLTFPNGQRLSAKGAVTIKNEAWDMMKRREPVAAWLRGGYIVESGKTGANAGKTQPVATGANPRDEEPLEDPKALKRKSR